ncbi:hypothetical protein B7P43_G10644 [Cryptotermes secundus]|uniref:Odorant receptor n=1 Tax=Cryptotermes secundus TaxID=105785 RepID=A0A2J7QBD6_9NEOP|nr:hypothetical protein B7P43_G10644 [Cryptotermes secundus]
MDKESRFRLFDHFFTYSGHPILKKRKSVIFRIYSWMAFLVAYACWLGEYIESFRHLDDLAEMQDAARIAIPLTACYGMDLYVRFKTAAFAKLLQQAEQFTWEDFPMTDESGNRTIAGLLPIIRKVMIHMTWLVTGPHTIYMYIRGADPDTLGLTMWTPFDIRPSPLHEIVIAIQVAVLCVAKLSLLLCRQQNPKKAYSTTYTLSNFLGYMGLYSTLATIACIQMEKLHQRLRNYRREEVTKPGTEEDYLREQIQYHQDILSFIRAIDDTFSMMMLGHFLMIIGALCFASISFVTAINVKQAIWDSGWIGAPIRQQRNIVFMMVAANEDFALSAGGFAPVSLRTMIVVRNTEHAEKRNAYRILMGKPEGERSVGRPRRRWVDNIKMNLREIGSGYLAQDTDQGRAFVNMEMNFWVP